MIAWGKNLIYKVKFVKLKMQLMTHLLLSKYIICLYFYEFCKVIDRL